MSDKLVKFGSERLTTSWSYSRGDALHLCAALRAVGIDAKISVTRPPRRDPAAEFLSIRVRRDQVDIAREFVRGWRAAMHIREDAGSFAQGVVAGVAYRAHEDRKELTAMKALPAPAEKHVMSAG